MQSSRDRFYTIFTIRPVPLLRHYKQIISSGYVGDSWIGVPFCVTLILHLQLSQPTISTPHFEVYEYVIYRKILFLNKCVNPFNISFLKTSYFIDSSITVYDHYISVASHSIHLTQLPGNFQHYELFGIFPKSHFHHLNFLTIMGRRNVLSFFKKCIYLIL